MFVLKCADLAPEGQEAKCDFVAKGETKEEVMEDMMKHGNEVHPEIMKKMMEGKSEEEMAKMKEDMMAKIVEE